MNRGLCPLRRRTLHGWYRCLRKDLVKLGFSLFEQGVLASCLVRGSEGYGQGHTEAGSGSFGKPANWQNCRYCMCSVAGVMGAGHEANTCLPLLTCQPPSSISPLADPKREPAVKEMSFLETATAASQSRVKKAGLEDESWFNHHFPLELLMQGFKSSFCRDER